MFCAKGWNKSLVDGSHKVWLIAGFNLFRVFMCISCPTVFFFNFARKCCFFMAFIIERNVSSRWRWRVKQKDKSMKSLLASWIVFFFFGQSGFSIQRQGLRGLWEGLVGGDVVVSKVPHVNRRGLGVRRVQRRGLLHDYWIWIRVPGLLRASNGCQAVTPG